MSNHAMDASVSRRDLRGQIAEEERLIRIYEAELALQRVSTAALPNVEDEDLLETLDALQSSGAPALESKSQDEPMVHRLLPLVGGVAFTYVRGLSKEDATRVYEFQGNVVKSISFTIILRVELRADRASVVALTTTFGSSSNELNQIAKVASETRSISLLFQHLVAWAEFDARRTNLYNLLRECQGKYDAMKRLSAETFVIQIIKSETTLCSLRLLWAWRCNWYERGREELCVEACDVSPKVTVEQSELAQWLREICDQQGLNDLVASTGSCEQTIRILMQALLDASS
jgi:hypothetical protein